MTNPNFPKGEQNNLEAQISEYQFLRSVVDKVLSDSISVGGSAWEVSEPGLEHASRTNDIDEAVDNLRKGIPSPQTLSIDILKSRVAKFIELTDLK